jgi:hypothetical protein
MAVVVLPFFLYTLSSRNMTKDSQDSEDTQDRSFQNSLYPEDQKKVDEFVSRGINSVERKPFRPGRLLLILIAVVTALSFLSQYLAQWAGVY